MKMNLLNKIAMIMNLQHKNSHSCQIVANSILIATLYMRNSLYFYMQER